MWNNGFGTGGWYWSMQFHLLLMLVVVVGLTLLIVWLVKNLKGKDLLKWAIILLVIGYLGSALTMGWGMRGYYGMMRYFSDGDQWTQMKEMMNVK